MRAEPTDVEAEGLGLKGQRARGLGAVASGLSLVAVIALVALSSSGRQQGADELLQHSDGHFKAERLGSNGAERAGGSVGAGRLDIQKDEELGAEGLGLKGRAKEDRTGRKLAKLEALATQEGQLAARLLKKEATDSKLRQSELELKGQLEAQPLGATGASSLAASTHVKSRIQELAAKELRSQAERWAKQEADELADSLNTLAHDSNSIEDTLREGTAESKVLEAKPVDWSHASGNAATRQAHEKASGAMKTHESKDAEHASGHPQAKQAEIRPVEAKPVEAQPVKAKADSVDWSHAAEHPTGKVEAGAAVQASQQAIRTGKHPLPDQSHQRPAQVHITAPGSSDSIAAEKTAKAGVQTDENRERGPVSWPQSSASPSAAQEAKTVPGQVTVVPPKSGHTEVTSGGAQKSEAAPAPEGPVMWPHGAQPPKAAVKQPTAGADHADLTWPHRGDGLGWPNDIKSTSHYPTGNTAVHAAAAEGRPLDQNTKSDGNALSDSIDWRHAAAHPAHSLVSPSAQTGTIPQVSIVSPREVESEPLHHAQSKAQGVQIVAPGEQVQSSTSAQPRVVAAKGFAAQQEVESGSEDHEYDWPQPSQSLKPADGKEELNPPAVEPLSTGSQPAVPIVPPKTQASDRSSPQSFGTTTNGGVSVTHVTYVDEGPAVSGNWTRRSAAGAFCKQDPTSKEAEPQQCAVWEQPAWGRMKTMPVGHSPQVANGCIEYVCKSVRAEPEKFLDQDILDWLKALKRGAIHIWEEVEDWFVSMWNRITNNHKLTYEERYTARQLTRYGLYHVKEDYDPSIIPAGSILRSVVTGCMYPFMNCHNQFLLAKRLCHDDGYWVRSVEGFHCTGGFEAAKTGSEEKWSYVDHFALSLLLLVGLVLLGLIVRARFLKHHPDMERKLWWLQGKSSSNIKEREVTQITL